MTLGISNFERLPWDVKIAFEDAEVQISTWLRSVPKNEDSLAGNTGAQSEGRHWRSKAPWLIDDINAHVVGLRPPDPPAGTYNNFAPQGIDDCVVIELEPSGNITLTGLKAREGYHKRFVFLRNRDTTNTITLKHANTGSLLPNQFSLPSSTDFAIGPNQNVWLYYDPGRKAYTLAGGQGSGAILPFSVDLTEAQIESLFTTPVTVIPAAGAGTIIIPLHFTLYVTVPTAYSTSPLWGLAYDGLSTTFITDTVQPTMNSTGSNHSAGTAVEYTFRTATFDPRNVGVTITLSANPGTPGTGVATATVKGKYYLETGVS